MTTLLIALLLSAPAADSPGARVATLDRELREAHRAWAEATRVAASPEAAATPRQAEQATAARAFVNTRRHAAGATAGERSR